MIENRISDRAKILLIDEDTSISYLIRRAMEKENYKIYIAGSGKQGMEMSTGVCPDLILMDNKFSDMEGITLIQWFREWTDCPIIILSERSSYLDKVEALYAGADDYMVKPFHEKELAARIFSAVSAGQALSTSLSEASLKISRAAFSIKMQITSPAAGSRTGKPSLAPRIPANAPTDERASER